MYLITDEATNEASVVDPWDYNTIGEQAEKSGVKVGLRAHRHGSLLTGLQVTSIITTHHHNDHSGGNANFLKAHPGIPVYGGSKQGQAVDTVVKDGDTFKIGKNIDVR